MRRLRFRASRLSWTLLLVALPACGGDERPAPPGSAAPDSSAAASAADGDGPLVAFLGDSLAAGLHVDPEQAFPARIHELLGEEGVPFRLINAGVSGDTTAGGLRRIDWLLKQRPDWVVLELGGNDGLRGITLGTIESNLRGIVEKAKAAGARVWLLGLCLPANYGRDYGAGFEALYARVAEDEELPFVPCFLEGVGGVARLNQPDGIHPTAEGHERLAQKLAPLLGELLEDGD